MTDTELGTETARIYRRIAGATALAPLGRSLGGRPILGTQMAIPHLPQNSPGIPSAPVAAYRCGPRLLIVGAVHGDEPASAEAVMDLVERMRATRFADDHGAATVWLIPALNPDGLIRNRKNNDRDVDLNRNFPATNFSPAHEPGYHPGAAALSEPETATLARLVHQEKIDAVVAVHAPFACVNFDGPARAWAETVSASCGWPVRENIGYPTPGSLGTWLGVDCGIPILTLELPPGTLAGFRAAAAAALDAAISSVPRPLPHATR